MADTFTDPKGSIVLSQVTSALIQATKGIKQRVKPDEYNKISVSRAVSFFAIAYERVRNAIEYREDHLVRRAAIERIVRRRLALNPTGNGEAENLIRELLWARYFPIDSLSETDAQVVQKIFDTYAKLKAQLVTGRARNSVQYLETFLLDLLTCEIEEALSSDVSARENLFTYFVFQSLKNKFKIEGLGEDVQNAFLLTAIEKAYRRSDVSYQRYHLFTVFYQPLASYESDQLSELAPKLPQIFSKIDDTLKSPMVEKIYKFVRKQLPPFLILFSLIKNTAKDELVSLLSDKAKLWSQVDYLCRQKYAGVQSRLRGLAVRSLIYIFITKMLLAIVLEGPLSLQFYGEVEWVSIIINSVFPPILMLVIILANRLPDDENTRRIYGRIVDIIDSDTTFENKVIMIAQKPKARRPALQIGFSLLYLATFVITLYGIRLALVALHFNLISQAIFLFFVSTVAFFSHRIKSVAAEYKLIEKDSFFTPFFDFFFMPMLAIGKFLSNEIARLNFFTFIFDVLIEAPYKLIIEIIEEWISFTRRKKEEIL